jgi:phage baseplate assembly protein W
MKPIGIDLPIRRGRQGGFQQTFTTQNAVKSNLKNTLLTNFGERPLNPTFGNNLRRFVFEQDIEATKIKVENSIRETISSQFPSLIIEDLTFENIDDNNRINVSVSFSIAQYPEQIERVNLDLKIGN